MTNQDYVYCIDEKGISESGGVFAKLDVRFRFGDFATKEEAELKLAELETTDEFKGRKLCVSKKPR